MPNNLVSIIVPIYKVEKYIQRCIDSLVNQTYGNIEIILVDDGSPDQCPQICDEAAQRDNRIKVIHKINGGLSDARNKGLDIATGDYIQFVDSDDFLELDAIEKTVEVASTTNADIVIYDLYKIYNDYIKENTPVNLPLISKWSQEEFFNYFYKGHWLKCVVAWNKLYKKSIFTDLRYDFGKIHEDEFIITKIIEKSDNIVYYNLPLYNYVQRSDSIMGGRSIKSRIDLIDSLINRLEYLLQKEYFDLSVLHLDRLLSEVSSIVKISAKTKIQDKQIKNQLRKIKSINLNQVYIRSSFKGKVNLLLFKYCTWLYLLFKKDFKFKYLLKKFLKCAKFKTSTHYKELCGSKQNKVFLLDTPTHGNLGDHAIAIAENKFIAERLPDYIEYEFTHSDCQWCLPALKSAIHINDMVFVPGGGFIGSLWPNEHKTFLNIIKKLKKKRLVVFPQTIFFNDNDSKLKIEFIKCINKCKNMTLFVREQKSYDFLVESKAKCRFYLIPDIVLSIAPIKSQGRNGKVLLCFRSDLEKTSNHESVIKLLSDNGLQYDFTDTVIHSSIKQDDREVAVYRKLEEFAKYSLIICDRLHALIFSTIAQTPCIAFDNVSKKVSGVYQWIKDVDYITCIEESNLNIEIVKEYMNKQNNIFDTSLVQDKFDLMCDIIKG